MKKKISFNEDDFKVYLGVKYEIDGMSSRGLYAIIDGMPSREFLLMNGFKDD